MMIDHVCLATRNVYVTASRLRERLGLESYDGGWFPHTGVAMRVVPLPGATQYIEIESVMDAETAQMNEWAQWFAANSREEGLVGWTLRCESLEELEAVGRRLNMPVGEYPRVREMPDGSMVGVTMVAPTPIVWPRGLPNFVAWTGGAHPGKLAPVKPPRDEPTEISWISYADPEGTLRDWLGPDFDALPIRMVDGPKQGIQAVGLTLKSGREVELRPMTPADGARPWYEPIVV